MATVMSRGNFPEALWPGIANLWGQSYKENPKLYSQFFQVEKSDKAFEKDQQFTGFPKAAVKESGANAFYSQMYQGLQQEYRHITYAIGGMITREMVEDDQYGIIKKIPALLARSMRSTEETVATNVLNNAGNAAITYADGQPLASTAHTLVATGGTYANRPASYGDLSETTLEAAIVAIMGFVDDQGLPIVVEPKALVVPVDSSFIVRKILETKQTLGSNNNDKNIVATMPINPVVTPYITDTDSWFLTTNVSDGLKFYDRRAAEIEKSNDFDTQNMKVLTSRRFSVGVTDPRGVWCNFGA